MKYNTAQGTIELNDDAFLAEGGQAKVYVKNHLAYKIYSDSQYILPIKKFQELSVLEYSTIIKPQELIYQQGKVVGYNMTYIENSYVLCQLFTKAFRNRHKLSFDMILNLVRKLQEQVAYVHQKKILIVDLNEMNILASKDFKDLYLIDVDSWQTPSFPATVLMPTVRDYHTTSFSELTDWFAFAITSFQMFIGASPYKGKHPTVKKLEDRMKQNLSVFNPEVKLPDTCYSLDVIPEIYRHWYKSLFEEGKRSLPPKDLQVTITISPKIVQADVISAQLEAKVLVEYQNEIVYSYWTNNFHAAFTTQGVESSHGHNVNIPIHAKITYLHQYNLSLLCWIENNNLHIYNLTRSQNIDYNLKVYDIMEYDNRIYLRTAKHIMELQFVEIAKKILPSVKVICQTLEYGTKVYDGVTIQNVLGGKIFTIFPNTGQSLQFKIPELTSTNIIDAKYDSGVLMVLIAEKNGTYSKTIIRINLDDIKKYSFRKLEDVTYRELNFVTLDTGVCVHLVEDRQLELFKNDPTSIHLKLIKDSAISTEMVLRKFGSTLLYSQGSKLFSMKMK